MFDNTIHCLQWQLLSRILIQRTLERNDMNRFNERRNNRLPYLYKVHNAVYYRIPPMFNEPNGNLNLKAAQYLMLDSDRAIVKSMVLNGQQNNNTISEVNVEILNQMMTKSNSLRQLLMTNREVLREQNQRDPFNVQMRITRFVPRNANVPINANC